MNNDAILNNSGAFGVFEKGLGISAFARRLPAIQNIRLSPPRKEAQQTNGNPILDHYDSYLPELSTSTFIAIAWIVFGIAIVLYLEWLAYGRQKKDV